MYFKSKGTELNLLTAISSLPELQNQDKVDKVSDIHQISLRQTNKSQTKGQASHTQLIDL